MIRPRLVVVAADSPSWMRFTGRWGASRARLPFEQSSPRGPAFQGVRWRESALAGGALGVVGLLAGVVVWRRRRRA